MKRMIGYAVEGWVFASSLAVAGCSGSVNIGADGLASGAGGLYQTGGGGLVETGGRGVYETGGGGLVETGGRGVYETGGGGLVETGGRGVYETGGGGLVETGGRGVYETGGSCGQARFPNGGSSNFLCGAQASYGGMPVLGSPGGSDSPKCAQPAGTAATLATANAFYTAIEGRWLICAGGLGAFGTAPADVIGVEYGPLTAPTVDGAIPQRHMYFLVAGAEGPVRGTGFDYQLTYDVWPTDLTEGPPSQLNMYPYPNAFFEGNFSYSPNPLQWRITGGSVRPDAHAILVPAD